MLCVFENTDNEIFSPWREEVEQSGVKSCIATPLFVDDRILGVINAYSKHQHIFDNEEIALIEEIGRDLAFALNAIESDRERRRAAEALRLSEERYRTLFDAAGDAIFVLDFNGKLLDVNRTACQRLGYLREELVGMSLTAYRQPRVCRAYSRTDERR